MASFIDNFSDQLIKDGLILPQFIRGLDLSMEWPYGKQLSVKVTIRNAEKVEWFLDDQQLKNGDDGVQIFDSLSTTGKGSSLLELPAALQRNMDKTILRVCVINEIGETESAGQIRLTPPPLEVPTTAKSSRRRTNGIDTENGQKQMEKGENKSKEQKEGQKEHNLGGKRMQFDGSFEVLDSGNAFHAPMAATKGNTRRASVNGTAQIQVEKAQMPMPSNQKRTIDNKQQSKAIDGDNDDDTLCQCPLCPGVFASPKGLNIHRALKHFACVICGHLADSLDALKVHKQESHISARKSLSANVHNQQQEKTAKRRESAMMTNRLTLRGINERLEKFEGRQMGENERMNYKIDNLRSKFENINILDREQTEKKAEEIEEFLSEDDAK